MNLMLTGRLGMAAPGAKALPQTVFAMTFDGRPGGPSDAAPWTRGAAWLPPDDGPVELRDRDATKMGKVYLVPPASPVRSPAGMTWVLTRTTPP